MSLGPGYWADAAARARLGQLAHVRKVAENWRNGLLGLSGLLAVLTTIKGVDTFADLPPERQRLVPWLLLTAFAGLLAGAFAAMSAAFGAPRGNTFLTGPELERWTLETEPERIRTRLTQAKLLFAVGLVAAVAAVQQTWFVPEGAPPEEVLAEVTGTDGQTLCGAVRAVEGTEITLRVTDSHGRQADTTIPRDRIQSVDLVPACAAGQ